MELSIGKRLLLSVDVPPSADLFDTFEILKRGEADGVWICFKKGTRICFRSGREVRDHVTERFESLHDSSKNDVTTRRNSAPCTFG